MDGASGQFFSKKISKKIFKKKFQKNFQKKFQKKIFKKNFKKNFYPWQNVHGVCFLITQHTFNKVAGQFSK